VRGLGGLRLWRRRQAVFMSDSHADALVSRQADGLLDELLELK
jgi:hypothetical protein